MEVKMSDEQVIRHCAPTLASIKTANLFSSFFVSRQEMLNHVRNLNFRLRGKGLRMLALLYKDHRGLIYVYRPDKLSRDLQNELAKSLLYECGYTCTDENKCIQKLIEKLAHESDFPHEIGLFLGYPPEDVDGFINRRNECKYCGFWKVYGDVDAAQKLFSRYRKCTNIYCRLCQEGKSIESLTVAA